MPLVLLNVIVLLGEPETTSSKTATQFEISNPQLSVSARRTNALPSESETTMPRRSLELSATMTESTSPFAGACFSEQEGVPEQIAVGWASTGAKRTVPGVVADVDVASADDRAEETLPAAGTNPD